MIDNIKTKKVKQEIMSAKKDFYLKFNVKDFRTDPKLCDCSAEANGVYIHIMCVLFDTESRGKFLIKSESLKKFAEILPQQNDRQINQQTIQQLQNICCSIAEHLVKHLPFNEKEISRGLEELLANNVLYLEGYHLCQKRMIHDAAVSKVRSSSGKKGAAATNKKNKDNKKNEKSTVDDDEILPQQNDRQNPNYNYNYNYNSIDEDKGVLDNTRGGMGETDSGEKGEEGKKKKNTLDEKYADGIAVRSVDAILQIYFSSNYYTGTREQVALSNHMDLVVLREFAQAFNRYLISSGKSMKEEADWVNHFYHWMAKQDKSKDPKSINSEKFVNASAKNKVMSGNASIEEQEAHYRRKPRP